MREATMHAFRTVLEQRIRERQQTLEEFVEYAERFAREHGESGTLSLRHLQRLVSGRGPGGKPLGPVRAATARLLERIFDMNIGELLTEPSQPAPAEDPGAELRQRIHTSNRIDDGVFDLLQDQLTALRRLDRQLGAVVAHEEVRAKTSQVQHLFDHSLTGGVRQRLAVLLSELRALAGWQALDLGKATDAWHHYEQAKAAARESGNIPHEAHAEAEQAFVLLDIKETAKAVDLLTAIRERASTKCPSRLRSWLAAAHGEALAANDQRDSSLRSFDTAAEALPANVPDEAGPYIALNGVHLARWRGHALARFAGADAVETLTNALARLDPTFKRAETSLRVDLALAFQATGEPGAARDQLDQAQCLSNNIGSARQHRRIEHLRAIANLL
jgi:hypothetical protein